MEKLDDDDREEEKERGLSLCPQTLISEPNHKRGNKITTVPDLELSKLERGDVSSFFFLFIPSLFIFCALNVWTLLIAFLLVRRFLPEQSVPASLC